MLIRGDRLTARQRGLVLAAFSYRWTRENRQREQFWAKVKGGRPTIPLQTDTQWLREHAYYFIKDGSRLNRRHRFCEPHYLAEQ